MYAHVRQGDSGSRSESCLDQKCFDLEKVKLGKKSSLKKLLKCLTSYLDGKVREFAHL